jgi:hypothetical protein
MSRAVHPLSVTADEASSAAERKLSCALWPENRFAADSRELPCWPSPTEELQSARPISRPLTSFTRTFQLPLAAALVIPPVGSDNDRESVEKPAGGLCASAVFAGVSAVWEFPTVNRWSRGTRPINNDRKRSASEWFTSQNTRRDESRISAKEKME